ncbi:membrane protein, partial [Bradyrhizobium sp. DOA1]
MKVVMPGLAPGIHGSPRALSHVDGRVKPGHDELRMRRPHRSPLTRFLMTLPAAVVSLFFSSAPAHADL